MLEDENKKINLIKAPLKKSDIKERGINAKKKKSINNILWFKDEIEKNKKKIPKELKIKRKKEQI